METHIDEFYIFVRHLISKKKLKIATISILQIHHHRPTQTKRYFGIIIVFFFEGASKLIFLRVNLTRFFQNYIFFYITYISKKNIKLKKATAKYKLLNTISQPCILLILPLFIRSQEVYFFVFHITRPNHS